MTTQQPLRLTAETFISWAMEQTQGRYELTGGEVVAMAAERAEHMRTKIAAFEALEAGLETGKTSCEVMLDGMAVRIDDVTVYEPDVLLRCGERTLGEAVSVSDPLIVVEVLSPSTRALDSGVKLADYFRLATLRHYLVVNTHARSVTHHARPDPQGDIATRILREGTLTLDPPGITVPLEAFFARL